MLGFENRTAMDCDDMANYFKSYKIFKNMRPIFNFNAILKSNQTNLSKVEIAKKSHNKEPARYWKKEIVKTPI